MFATAVISLAPFRLSETIPQASKAWDALRVILPCVPFMRDFWLAASQSTILAIDVTHPVCTESSLPCCRKYLRFNRPAKANNCPKP